MTPSHIHSGAANTTESIAARQGPRPSHHFRQFDVMGAHVDGDGTRFTVWAPNARDVGVAG